MEPLSIWPGPSTYCSAALNRIGIDHETFFLSLLLVLALPAVLAAGARRGLARAPNMADPAAISAGLDRHRSSPCLYKADVVSSGSLTRPSHDINA